jgi:atypical dual specificity phosphatase
MSDVLVLILINGKYRSVQKQLEVPTKKEKFEKIVVVRTEDDVTSLLRNWGVMTSTSAEAQTASPVTAECVDKQVDAAEALDDDDHDEDVVAVSSSRPAAVGQHSSELLKFPRTSHLLNLGSASRDDKILGRAGLESLLTMLLTNQRQHPESAVRNHIRIIVEEKVDGANMGISINSSTGQIQVQNRSHYITATYHSQFAPLNKWLAEHSAELWTVLEPDRHVLYGEWLYATHSVRYDTLPGWFIAYDVFDRIAGSFLSRDQLTAMLAETSIPIVPLIAAVELSAPTSSASVSASAQAISIVDRLVTYVNGLSAFINSSNPSQNKREGVVIRICENEQVTHRCKLVRPDFICGNERWNKSHTLECNSLAEFNESSTDASA